MATTQTNKNRNEDIEARVGVLEFQFASFSKSLDRIEAKQDAAIRQIDTLKYVSTHEFDKHKADEAKDLAEFKKEVADKYVSVESNRAMRTLFWSIITASVLGLISLLFFIIQSLIK